MAFDCILFVRADILLTAAARVWFNLLPPVHSLAWDLGSLYQRKSAPRVNPSRFLIVGAAVSTAVFFENLDRHEAVRNSKIPIATAGNLIRKLEILVRKSKYLIALAGKGIGIS